MNPIYQFCVAKIDPGALLRAPHGVLRAGALRLTQDAGAAAAAILADAGREAARITQQARAGADAAVAAAERQTLARAGLLLDALRRQQDALLEGAQELVADLALALFDRLVGELSPRERMAANCRRLMQETPRQLTGAVLFVHPEDSAAGAPLAAELGWDCKADPALAAGRCRLEASAGEWCADLAAGAAELRAAFAAALAAPAGADA